MSTPEIKVTISDWDPVTKQVSVSFRAPTGINEVDLIKAVQGVLENAPKPPRPGDVTRKAYKAVVLGPHFESEQQCWAAAEAAAREGYVSKAEIRKALEEFNPYGAETVDVLGVVDDIRELVK